MAADAAEWARAPQVLQAASPAERARFCARLFDFMRQGLCIATRYLDRTELEQLRTQSYANLREPWGFTETSARCRPAGSSPTPARRSGSPRPPLNLEDFLVIGSSRSRLGRSCGREHMGRRQPLLQAINDKTYPDVSRRC